MQETKLEPHRITKPFQLLAAWISGLVLLVGAFVGGAVFITEPSWLQALFGVAAVIIVPLFIVLIFIMQTRYRPQLQDDPYYAEYLKKQMETFKDFAPENLQYVGGAITDVEADNDLVDEPEKRRNQRYINNRGVFLVHTWRRSHIPGQFADIAISLHQHGDGPLSEGKVDSVEYHLGPKFFQHPVVKTDASENFRLDVSAYGPMLCLARVYFNDGTAPLELERYINFQ